MRIIKCSRNSEIKIITTGAGKTILIDDPEFVSKVSYEAMTKKELGVVLTARDIEHDQRQLKSELIDLIEDDKR